jgi:hypothetical protein
MSESPSSPPPEPEKLPETSGAETTSSPSPSEPNPPSSSVGWAILWLLAGLTTLASCGTSALFLGVLSKPHSFGGRDGEQGAAIVALILVVGGAVALVSLPLTLWSGHKLRARGTTWAFHAAWAVPLALGGLAFLYGFAIG